MTRKITFFERWSQSKFNNWELALGMASKFGTSVARGLNLKVRKFWWVILTFVEVAGKTLVGGPPSWIGLRGQSYERNWFISRPYQKSECSFTWLGKIVNPSMTKKLNYASPDWIILVKWFTSTDRISSLNYLTTNVILTEKSQLIFRVNLYERAIGF